jgi:hypothetical protein
MSKKNIAIILFVSLAVAGLASFFASSHPDGLEWVAERLGFLERATDTFGVMPDYACPFVKTGQLATTAAGIFGVAVCFGIFFLARAILRRTN